MCAAGLAAGLTAANAPVATVLVAAVAFGVILLPLALATMPPWPRDRGAEARLYLICLVMSVTALVIGIVIRSAAS
jgi:hypothetical protein